MARLAVRAWLGVVLTLACAATADAQIAQGPQAIRAYSDVFVTGIEVTQGVQSTVTPYFDGSGDLSADICAQNESLAERDLNDVTQKLTYDGVKLVRKRKTVVRVFAHPRFGLDHSVGDVAAVLYGYRDGEALSDSPLAAEEGPRDLDPGPYSFTTCLERADPKGAYTFTLPDSWTKGTIKLKAKVLPDTYLFGDGGECAGERCADDNTLTLKGVTFEDTGHVTVTPVQLVYHDPTTKDWVFPPAPEEVLADPAYDAPAELRYDGGDETTYAGWVDIDDEVTDPDYAQNTQDNRRAQCDDIDDELEDWADDNEHGDVTFGVFNPQNVICLGLSGGTLLDDGFSYPVVNPDSLAHEMGHGFGRSHSDPPSADCGGEGEDWPPDQKGEMHGIGTDTRDGSGGSAGIYKIVVHRKLTPGDPFGFGQDSVIYDLMSYCGALDKRNTLSDVGWDEAFAGVKQFMDQFHPGRYKAQASRAPAARAAAASGPVLRVRAAAEGDSARLLSVRRLPAPRPLRRGPSPFTAVFKGPRGGVLAVVPMIGRTRDLHSSATPYLVAADMPLGRAPVASVEIHRGDALVASRTRSAHAPTVSLTAPRSGGVLRRTARSVAVDWTAGDADNDRLRIAIDYTATGVRGWRRLYGGPNRGSVALPRRLFAASRRARVRVRASDGFNEAAAVSGKFAVQPVPPILRLDTPERRVRMRDGSLTHLHATATAALGARVRDSSITWSEDGHVLQRGSELTEGLSPGTHDLTVTAVADRLTVSQHPIITILTSPAHVLSYSGPTSLGATAKTLTFEIKTTTDATLHVASETHSVGTTKKSITVNITPGHSDLELPFTLTTGGHTTTCTIVVPRD